jgi:glutaredoxin
VHEAQPAFGELPERDETGRPLRVTMLSRQGCHLCDRARSTLVAVCEATGTGWAEADVDDHPALVPLYGELLPVVFVDGRRHDYWQVDAGRLASALSSRGKPV